MDPDPGWDPLIGFLDRSAKVASGTEYLNFPKRKSDKEKLAALFEACRRGNIRETRAIVLHSPNLLPLTDEYGFTALHHAQISRNADFYAQLLELFNDPKTFVKKLVRYDTADELRRDNLRLHRKVDINRPDGGLITVRQVSEGSRAEWRDVVEGDYLDIVFTDALRAKRLRTVMEELVSIARGDPINEPDYNSINAPDYNFPVTFDFRGPACREILKESSVGLRAHVTYGVRTKKKKRGAKHYTQITSKPQNLTSLLTKKTAVRPHLSMSPTLLVRERSEFDKVDARKDQQKNAKSGNSAGVVHHSVSLPALVKPVDVAQANSYVSKPSVSRSTPAQRLAESQSENLIPSRPIWRPKQEKLPEIVTAPSQSVFTMNLDSTDQHKLLF